MLALGLSLGLDLYLSEGSPFPSQVAGNVLRLESDLGITTVGSDVDVWADQSGNGNNAPAPAAINRPAYGTNQLNSIDVLTFDGANTQLNAVDVDTSFTDEVTLFVVASLAPTSPNFSMFATIGAGTTNANGGIELRQNGTTGKVEGFVATGSGTAGNAIIPLSSAAYDDDVYRVYTLKADFSNGGFLYVNGTQVGTDATFTGSSISFDATADSIIGARQDGFFHEGDIAAVLAYNVALSDEDRDSVEVYLANKYGLPHPNATWVQALDEVEQAAVLAGSISRDEYNSTGISTVVELRLESDLGITTVGSDVDSWADQSGNGNDLIAAAASNRPLYVEDELNGVAVLQFADTGPEYLENTNIGSFDLGQCTIFTVHKWNDLTDNNARVSFTLRIDGPNNITAQRSSPYTDDKVDFKYKENNNNHFISPTVGSGGSGNWFISSQVINDTGNSWKLFIDGTEIGEDTSIGSITSGTIICSVGSNNSGNNPSNAEFAALIVYNTVLSDTDRGRVETYLSTKYGITI